MDIKWVKSSYSGPNGGECVEVGVWIKSSHSGPNDSARVELANSRDEAVLIRDSKSSDQRALRLGLSAMGMLLADIRSGKYDM